MTNPNLVVILVGVCGTGKSAIGQKIARRLKIPFFDAEKLPISDVVPSGKLPQDVNLDQWLLSIQELIKMQSAQKGCVISCSILKKEHRVMLTDSTEHPLDWVFMQGSYDYVAQQVQNTKDHARSPTLLKSDFENLEIPKRALTIDITATDEDIENTILKYLVRKYE